MKFAWRRALRLGFSGIISTAISSFAHADDAASPSGLITAAEWRERVIATATFFAFGGVGRGGELPPEINAVRGLLDDPEADADAAFKRLAAAESLPTRLYGLSGLYFTDRVAFEKGVSELAKSDARVATMHGCIRMEEDVATLIRLPGGESVVLRPGETLAAWARRNPTKEIKLDISGGGIPYVIRNRDRAGNVK